MGGGKSVYLHHSQLTKNGKYLGVMVNCSGYEYLGINKGDALILKEEENYKTGDKVLACINNKFYYLGKIAIFTAKNRSFEKFDSNHIRIRNFTPKARLISLFRDFRTPGN